MSDVLNFTRGIISNPTTLDATSTIHEGRHLLISHMLLEIQLILLDAQSVSRSCLEVTDYMKSRVSSLCVSSCS